MKSLYNLHWVPTHAGGDDQAWIARWNPAIVKIVCNDETVPKIEYVPPTSTILVRNHPLSENYEQGRVLTDVADAQNKGRSAGVASMRTADWCEARGINRSRLLFEGLNEPQVYAGEPPDLLAAYEVARLEVLHKWNVRGVVCNFGVGWPGNDGTTGGLPIWGPYGPIINAMLPGDYLGLHEYWALDGPDQNWGWWAGRYEKCPYNVPILITECGIDLGVAGQPFGGWMNLPGNHDQQAAQYMNQLVNYEERCRKDARIKGLFIFTYDYGSNHWELMSVRDGVFMGQFFQYLDWLAPQVEPPPQQPASTFAAALAAKFGAQFEDLRTTLEQSASADYATRAESAIARIIVHHTATPAATTTWQGVANWHVNNNGWPGIGYHVGIGPTGAVSLLNDLTAVSFHAGDANADSLGLCLLGNFETETPTPAAVAALKAVVAVLDSYLARALPIVGHLDVAETQCPGAHLEPMLPTLRAGEPPVVVPVDVGLTVRNAGWNRLYPTGIAYVPGNAFPLYAKEHSMGLPVTGEFDLAVNGQSYRAQGFLTGVLYCIVGDWAHILCVEWL